MAQVMDRIDGVVIGLLMGLEAGVPQVVFAGNRAEGAVAARSLASLGYEMIGSEVALMFEDGDPARPLVIGRLVDPAAERPQPAVVRDGERVRIDGAERVELRCGAASIILEKDGRITIRGSYLTSQASAANHIRGASVHLN